MWSARPALAQLTRAAAHRLRRTSTVSRALSVSARALRDERVGFIGLGNMGNHMARNLRKAGHSLVVFDVNQATVDQFVKDGATAATTPKEVAAEVDTVVTMLPSNPHVTQVYLGEDGLFAGAKDGTLFIDASTVEPSLSKKVSQQADEIGVHFADAPVSGGVGAAEAGTLTFMVGGTEPVFQRASVLLKKMGKNVFHCGPAGSGQAVKICNNMLLAIEMIGVSEAMSMGQKLGIDAKLLASIINTSTGRCWSSDTYNPCPGVMEGVPASRGYTGGFGSALMLKDLGLAMAAAKDNGCSVPLGSLAHQIYMLNCSQGNHAKDFSSVFELVSGKKLQ